MKRRSLEQWAALISEADAAIKSGGYASYEDFCQARGISANGLRGRKSELKRRGMLSEPITIEERGDELLVTSNDGRIRTIDDLIAACQLDLEYWELVDFWPGSWEGYRRNEHKDLTFDEGKITGRVYDEGGMTIETLFTIRAHFRRRTEKPYQDALQDILVSIRKAVPRHRNGRKPTGDYLLVPNIYDFHLNKRSADEQYTIDRAAMAFRAAVDDIGERAGHLDMPVKRILVPVGHDALHADDLAGRTTKGTWVELAGEQRTAIAELISCYRYFIERMAELAHVDVIMVESNHDRLAVYWLGQVLDALFSKDERVTVTHSEQPRQYYRFGKVLLGMAHGDEIKAERLATLMPHEAPELWAATEYREYLTGHLHKQSSLYLPVTEERGVMVRIMPSLSPPDKWHVLHGFVGNHRAAEMLYYHSEHGHAGSFPIFVQEAT